MNIPKIALEEHFVTPDFDKFIDHGDNYLVEYIYERGVENNYDYLLDPDNRRLKNADSNNTTLVCSLTVPGSSFLRQDLPTTEKIRFCQRANNYFYWKLTQYNLENKTYHSFFGCIPLTSPYDALNELKRLNNLANPINRILINGAGVNDNNYDWLDKPEWNIFWEYADQNKTIIYIHPWVALTYSDSLPDKHNKAYMENYSELIGSQYGFHINTGIFYLKLYIRGVFDRYPNITWFAGHMGESLIWFLWRFDHRTEIYKETIANFTKDELKKYDVKIQSFPKNTLSQLFKTQKGKLHAQIISSTSGWFDELSLKYAIDNVGVENICFAIDTPYEKFLPAINWFNKLNITDYEKNRIGWENANNILNLIPKDIYQTFHYNNIIKRLFIIITLICSLISLIILYQK